MRGFEEYCIDMVGTSTGLFTDSSAMAGEIKIPALLEQYANNCISNTKTTVGTVAHLDMFVFTGLL